MVCFDWKEHSLRNVKTEAMIRTHVFPCRLPKETADALNRESGRIYTGVLVEHYRILRHSDHWLSPGAGEKVSDHLSTTFLHAHSRDAAQQGFYKACKTAHVQKSAGMKQAHYLVISNNSAHPFGKIQGSESTTVFYCCRWPEAMTPSESVCRPSLGIFPRNRFLKCGWSGIGLADAISGTA